MLADLWCRNQSHGAQRSRVASLANRLDSSGHLADAYWRSGSSCIWVACELPSDRTINRTSRAGLVGIASSIPARRLELLALVGRHPRGTRVRCSVGIVRGDDV